MNDGECLSSEKLALLLDNKLSETERKAALLHIADCNDCAMKYALAKAVAKTVCLTNETIALLLDNKLGETERKEALLHIADCNDCAMKYSLAKAVAKTVCLSNETIALLLDDKLGGEERKAALLHIADCNDCAIKYSLAKAVAKTVCLSHETTALLLDNKLNEAERKAALLHIADCNDCAIKYSIAKELHNDKGAEASIPKAARITPIRTVMKYLQKAAIVVLLIGAGYLSGERYPGAWDYLLSVFSDENLTRGQTTRPISGDFSNNSSYKRVLNIMIWDEIQAQLPQGISEELQTTVSFLEDASIFAELVEKKNILDERLTKILNLSERDIDIILWNDNIDILALSPENVEVYAQLLKQGKEAIVNYARDWLLLDQNRYFSLCLKVPQDIWERYPATQRSYEVIDWITNLPEDQQKEKWGLPSWRAEEDYTKSKEETTINTPN